MTWVKLDDQFTDHPKVVEAGPMAAWLYVCGLAYCARQLTDGFIPAGQLRKLLTAGSVLRLAQRLVDVRLWEVASGGFRIHDYLRYNPTRQQVLALREQKASAGRKGGWQKASKALAECQASATTPKPIPKPIPKPTPRQSVDPATEESGEPDALTARARDFARPVSKPSGEPAALAKRRETEAWLTDAFHRDSRPNAEERRAIERAAGLFFESAVGVEELPRLLEAARERWSENAECTPMALARNVTNLRAPRPAKPKQAPPNGVAAARDEFRRITEELRR